MTFEQSPQYKKAQEEYIEKMYKDILSPAEVIQKEYRVLDETIYLCIVFYPQEKVQDIFNEIIKQSEAGKFQAIRKGDPQWEERLKELNENFGRPIYKYDGFINTGYEKPFIKDFSFMGVTYKAIYLYYYSQDEIPFKL